MKAMSDEAERVHDWDGPSSPTGLFDWFVCRNEGCYLRLCLLRGERPLEDRRCVDVREREDAHSFTKAGAS